MINAINLLPVRTASCSVMGDYALMKKMTVPYSKARKGDVVLYDFNGNGTSDHTGIIYKVKNGKIYVVEGNTSQSSNDNGGCVMKRTRVKRQVNYIVRPNYNDEVTANMVVKTALAQVGVKEKPRNSNNVKYNTWYYGRKVSGDKYPWCMTFVQWIFAHVKEIKDGLTYPGKFPELPTKTAKLAVKCAYKYGTSLRKYSYKKGKPKPEYKVQLNKAYPKRSHWKYAQSRAGASCDVFAGTVLKLAGYRSAPHTMSTMVDWCRRNLTRASSIKNGDILTRTNHVMVVVDLRGKKRVANAHFLDHGGTYGIIQKIGQYTHIWRTNKMSYFSEGDEFTDMKYLKNFLNWYGNYGLKGYTFGEKTLNAVKDFQTKEGLTVDGKFGAECLKRAKEIRK